MVRKTDRGFYALATALLMMGVIASASGLAFGQGFSGTLSGVVRDATGSVVPDAAITVRNVETGLTRTAQTGANGGYNVPALPVGPYELTVEKAGFKQQVRMGIRLVVGQEAVVNFNLEVGAVQQTVEVTGEAPIVNTTLSSTSGLINEGQIKDMPLNGRSFEELLTLNVGTVNNESNAQWSSFSVAGKRTETNRFTLNGVDYVGDNPAGQFNAPQGISGSLLGVDAVREYNVIGHTYGAEYGKRAGGQVTVVTSSGTNQLHGGAFEYLRNSALDAKNFFDANVAPFKRNQFGGKLGGPILRDKMFVFGNYEGFRERLGVSTRARVPSKQARQGLLPNASGVYAPIPNLAPGMLPFFRYWPEPNGPELLANGLPTGIAFHDSNPSRPVQEDFGLVSYDYNVRSQDSVSTSLTADKGNRLNPTDNPIFFQNDLQDLYTLSVRETHIFSPTILSIGTFGFSSASADRQTTPNEPFPDNLLLMKGGGRSNPGAFIIGGAGGTNQPAVFTPANGSNLLYNRRQNFSGAYDLRITQGRHNLSLGVWFQRIRQASFSSGQNNAGTAQYATLLAFLQDRPTQFQAAPNPIQLNFRSAEAAWYFQDEIKLRPNLTVRLGLRDEMTTGWNEKYGRAANYSFDTNGVILTNPFIGKSALLENNAIALWQPRVGVAWDPSGKGTWSVRAGFGIHNDLQDNLAQRLSANPPFAGRVLIENTPLLSFIPIVSDAPPAPQCQTLAEANQRPPICNTYAPGGIDPIIHTPTIQQWSLEIERGITQDLAVQVSYVGSEAYHTAVGVDMNTIRPQVCENPTDPRGCAAGGTRPAVIDPITRESRAPTFVPPGATYIPWGAGRPNMRPNPVVGSTQGWFYFGTSSYHALNASLTKRSRGGLTFKTNYTWAKVLDLDSGLLSTASLNDTATILTRFNTRLSHGLAAYSLQHQFNTNFSYPLPFGKGKAFGGGAGGWVDTVIGGWQWNGILNIQGGFPITPQVGSNPSGNGDARNPDTPNRNPNFQGKVIRDIDAVKKDPLHQYFDPKAFGPLPPPTGTFGTVARGSFRGPGLVNLDMSLFKRIPLNEKWNMQFRAEAFNILNHVNLNVPNPIVFEGTAISGAAGVITQTANRERLIQFALRLEF